MENYEIVARIIRHHASLGSTKQPNLVKSGLMATGANVRFVSEADSHNSPSLHFTQFSRTRRVVSKSHQ